jgi:ABC-type multidrug transport system ATPase subunit
MGRLTRGSRHGAKQRNIFSPERPPPPLIGVKRRGGVTDLLELAPLLRKPMRTLSLGERMKCELVAALLSA